MTMKFKSNFYFMAFSMLALASCQSTPSVVPKTSDLTVKRIAPDSKDCRELSKVTGMLSSAKGTPEQALEDLKKEAANKGANYLWVQEYSANGTSVTGMAYLCQ